MAGSSIPSPLTGFRRSCRRHGTRRIHRRSGRLLCRRHRCGARRGARRRCRPCHCQCAARLGRSGLPDYRDRRRHARDEPLNPARHAPRRSEMPRPSGHAPATAVGVNSIGGRMNCVNCTVATDATLAGRPASALGGGPFRLDVLEKRYGGRFGVPGPISSVSDALSAAGPGARGIVFGSRGGGEVGHVFNVVNQNGVVRFLMARLAVLRRLRASRASSY
jgi:hypothetical protein